MNVASRKTRAGKNGQEPPEHTKWRKGCQSPNPAGRPKIRWFSEAAKAILAEQHPRTQKSGAERLMEMAFRRALQGSYKHLELLLSYAEGKPTQSVDLKVSTLTRDERLVRLNDGELALANSLMRKTMLTADEQAQLGVLAWKMGQSLPCVPDSLSHCLRPAAPRPVLPSNQQVDHKAEP